MNEGKATALAAGLLFSLVLGGVVLAVGLGGYALPWQSINSAGGRASSASYALDASLGQTAAGHSGNAAYRLQAGFWPGARAPVTATATPTLSPTPTASPSPTATPPLVETWLPMILQAESE